MPRCVLHRRDSGSVRDRSEKDPIPHAACSRRHPHAHGLLPTMRVTGHSHHRPRSVRSQWVDSIPSSPFTRMKHPRGGSAVAAGSYVNRRFPRPTTPSIRTRTTATTPHPMHSD
jgi:hypothetical protein